MAEKWVCWGCIQTCWNLHTENFYLLEVTFVLLKTLKTVWHITNFLEGVYFRAEESNQRYNEQVTVKNYFIRAKVMPIDKKKHNSRIHVLNLNKILKNRHPWGQTFHRPQKLHKKPAWHSNLNPSKRIIYPREAQTVWMVINQGSLIWNQPGSQSVEPTYN